MTQFPSRNTVTNHVLAGLSVQDFGRLAPRLEAVDLPLRKMLERRQRKITSVYFPESGFASVVANGGSGQAIEVGLIGREGITGLAVVLGVDQPVRHETYYAGPRRRLVSGGCQAPRSHRPKYLVAPFFSALCA